MYRGEGSSGRGSVLQGLVVQAAVPELGEHHQEEHSHGQNWQHLRIILVYKVPVHGKKTVLNF